MPGRLRLDFGDEAEDAVNFMEFLILVERYGESLPPILIEDIHLYYMIALASSNGFAKKYCRYIDEAMHYVYEALQGFLNEILEENSPLGGD